MWPTWRRFYDKQIWIRYRAISDKTIGGDLQVLKKKRMKYVVVIVLFAMPQYHYAMNKSTTTQCAALYIKIQ